MARRFNGNRPVGGILIGQTVDFELFVRSGENVNFLNLKMVTKHPRLHKGNFWLRFDGKSLVGRDSHILAEQLPDYVPFVMKSIDEYGWWMVCAV